MRILHKSLLILSIWMMLSPFGMTETMDNFRIYSEDRKPGKVVVKFPDWFKQSFYDLPDDIAVAQKAGKTGIMVFLSYEHCTTCLAFMRTTFTDPKIIKRVTNKFDVIGMDIFSDLEVTDVDGEKTTVKDFAEKMSASLTPTILIVDVNKKQLAKMIGFYTPEKFQHVLDYIDGEYYASMKLNEYLQDKTIKSGSANKKITTDKILFKERDMNLSINKMTGDTPLLVLFERPNCNPCERFHQRVLNDMGVRQRFQQFRAIQLDATDDNTYLITPTGRRLTPKQWYQELNLSYEVATVFFSENGIEVLRHDAELGAYRMAYTMDYVLTKGYLEEKQVLRWRKKQVLAKRENKKI